MYLLFLYGVFICVTRHSSVNGGLCCYPTCLKLPATERVMSFGNHIPKHVRYFICNKRDSELTQRQCCRCVLHNCTSFFCFDVQYNRTYKTERLLSSYEVKCMNNSLKIRSSYNCCQKCHKECVWFCNTQHIIHDV